MPRQTSRATGACVKHDVDERQDEGPVLLFSYSLVVKRTHGTSLTHEQSRRCLTSATWALAMAKVEKRRRLSRDDWAMSHQGLPGWFPECISCGIGNLGPIVCLAPNQEDQHDPIVIDVQSVDGLFEDGGHWFKSCQLCEVTMSADPGAFGSFALCADCWNGYVNSGAIPPTSPADLKRIGREGEDALRRWNR